MRIRSRFLKESLAFLAVLVGVSLAFVAWFADEASKKNDQAAVILVFMVVVDAFLILLFAIVAVATLIRSKWTARGS